MSRDKRPELDEAKHPVIKQGEPSQDSGSPAPSQNLEPPQVPEQYELLEQLGGGGMGRVFKARQRYTRQFVAIKFIKEETAGEAALQRFQREAQAACAFSHANAVRVLDFGVINESPYLVMEFVEGESLEARLKSCGALDTDETVSIFTNVSAALAKAHSVGVIHRDLKPSNIVLQKTEGGETAKVLDFGLAKVLGNEQVTLTQTGDVFGTPLYMSPEQLKGTKVDRRTDIYSIGAVMYECLTGQPPHQGDSAYSIMYKRLGDPPEHFSELNVNVPGELERIVFKCLAVAPDNRYNSAGELFNDLERFKRSQGLFASLLDRVEHSVKKGNLEAKGGSGRKRALLAITGIVLVFAVVLYPHVLRRLTLSERLAKVQQLEEQAKAQIDGPRPDYEAAMQYYSDAKQIVDETPDLTTPKLNLFLLEQMFNCTDHILNHLEHRNRLLTPKEVQIALVQMKFLNEYIKLASKDESAKSFYDMNAFFMLDNRRNRLAGVIWQQTEYAMASNNPTACLQYYIAFKSMLANAPSLEAKKKVQMSLPNIVDAATELGETTLALDSVQLWSSLAHELSSFDQEANAQAKLGLILRDEKRVPEAVKAFRQSLALYDQAKVPPWTPHVVLARFGFIELELHENHDDECKQLIEQQLHATSGTDNDSQWYRGQACRQRAELYLKKHDVANAAHWFDVACPLVFESPTLKYRYYPFTTQSILDFYKEHDPVKAKALKTELRDKLERLHAEHGSGPPPEQQGVSR
jgi:serine/threonine protein kinase